uniref:Uncharacterized protein n=1 Tax=Leptobrachium leishanense TaxID=445787 RepID=A0A8C5Q1C8_9ANUR
MDNLVIPQLALFDLRMTPFYSLLTKQETKIASDGLKGHVFEVSLADLQNDEYVQYVLDMCTAQNFVLT